MEYEQRPFGAPDLIENQKIAAPYCCYWTRRAQCRGSLSRN